MGKKQRKKIKPIDFLRSLEIRLQDFNLETYQPKKVGYARVSTEDQCLDSQVDALRSHGCDLIFSEKASGCRDYREELENALNTLYPGDTLIVTKLDRLGRSLKHLVNLVGDLHTAGINFCTLGESIDTSSSTGKLVFHIFAAIAEFERSLTIERTKIGLAAARARGRNGGRPFKLTPAKRDRLKELSKNHDLSIGDICKILQISRPSYYRYVDLIKGEQAIAK